MAGPMGADVVKRATKADDHLVVPGSHPRLHVPAVAEEHVFRPANLAAVEPQGCDRVESVGNEFHNLLIQK